MDKKKQLIIAIIGLALFLRLWGVSYGLPYFLVDDERAIVYSALKMGELKTLIPALHPEEFDIMNFRYNYLMSYVYLIFLIPLVLIYYLFGNFSNFSELINYFILNPAPIWLVARVVTALLGTATVYLIYLIGKKTFNYWVGITAALFFALSFFNIQLSHFTRPWVPMAFFICLIMLFSLHIHRSPKRHYYLWAGLAGGLAIGVSTGTAVGMAIFLATHFLSIKKTFWEKICDRNLWLALVPFAALSLFFLAGNPGSLKVFAPGGSPMDKNFSESLYGFFYYLKTIFFQEPLVSVFAVFALFILWMRNKKMFLAALSWPIFYIVVFALFFFSYPPVNRYIFLVLPWIMVLAGLGVYYFCLWFKSPYVKTIIIALIFLFPAAVSFKYTFLLSNQDTRLLAKTWVEENIPASARILSNWSPVNPAPTKEAILRQEKIDESSLRVSDTALLGLDEAEYPKPAYDILRLAYIGHEKWTDFQGYSYFLIAFWQENDLLPAERKILEGGQLIKEFRPGGSNQAERVNENFNQPIFYLFSLERLGPIVRIYKL